jgi:hypothetical protein
LLTTRPLEPEQTPLLSAFPHAVRVVNKSDRPAARDVAGVSGIHTVATTGRGVDELRGAIRKQFLGAGPFNPTEPRWWTERQRRVLERALLRPAALSEF